MAEAIDHRGDHRGTSMVSLGSKKRNPKRAGSGPALLEYEGVRPRVSRTPLVVNSRSVSLHSATDTVKISLYYQIDNRALLDALAVAKDALQATEDEEEAPFSWAGSNWVLSRRGVNLYQYHLRAGDVDLCLSTRDVSKKSRSKRRSAMPSASLRIGSVSSQLECIAVFERVVAWLERCGLTVQRDIVSELHLSVDCVGVELSKSDLVNRQCWVTRSRHSAIYYGGKGGDTVTGMMFGRGGLVLRVYDKILEMREKQDEVKQSVFSRLWGVDVVGKETVPVTRVEFQLRREVLREFKELKTFSDIMHGLKSIWEYCCNKWARHCSDRVDRTGKNQAHSRASALWEVICSASWADAIRAVRDAITIRRDPMALVRQGVGCLLSAVAADIDNVSHVQDDRHVFDRLILFVRKRFGEVFNSDEMRKRYAAAHVALVDGMLVDLKTGAELF